MRLRLGSVPARPQRQTGLRGVSSSGTADAKPWLAHSGPRRATEGPLTEERIVTAALLVIGDEILSGRTADRNIHYVAEHMTRVGIRLKEVRVVADEEDAIVAAVNELRARYTYLFTTGGIGPTHDDITSESVAKALGLDVIEDPRAIALLLERLK